MFQEYYTKWLMLLEILRIADFFEWSYKNKFCRINK